MDFQSIISTAQQNLSSSSEKGKYYSTKFAPPKKVTKEKRLTAGIQKFLEDKKREDEEKAEQARRKKQELVARRDPKEQRKIEKSLKVIKSSKKYFSGDRALDENNTLESEQPDEDDYGYTSTISDQFHKKLMEKYQKLPEDKKFVNSGRHKAMSKEEIQSTKDRMKNALASKDDTHQPHQFKQGRQERLSKIKSEKNKVFGPGTSALKAAFPTDKKNVIKPKPKLKAAPIVDFHELLKLAEKKQHEEIIIDVPTKKEPERLLTSKEKREQEELEAARRAKMKPNRIPKLGAIPKVGDPSKHDKNNNESLMRKPQAPTINGASKSLPVSMQRQPLSNTEKLKRSAPTTAASSSGSKLRDALLPKQNGSSAKLSQTNHKVPISSKAGTSSTSFAKPREAPKTTTNGQRTPAVAANSKARPGTSSKEPERTREFPPKDLIRSREFPPKDLNRSREFPPKDMMRSKEFPPRDPKRLKPQPLTANKRRIEDEDSEYDSEMDDFIDNGDAEEDYSSEIKKIFGYDKSRYRDEDFDDSQMESDYRTVMREEFISKKLGLMEDLEDMKMEAEEKKRKDMRKKRKL